MHKPITVPDRIWELWLNHRQTNFCWDPCDQDTQEYIYPRPLTEKSLVDPACACVWKALDSRYKEGAVRFVFDAIQTHSDGPGGSHALTPHLTRKRLGDKAARQALALIETLQEIGASATLVEGDAHYCGLPLEIAGPIDLALESIAMKGTSRKRLNFPEWYMMHRVVEHLSEVLDALSIGAEKWATTKPEVSGRGSNPSRLYFIRALTEDFRKLFNSPLREQVAALTRCVYGGDMDAATVAKLAP